ncbi:DUF4097 family beta strand repeat-containing protein [Paenibacillus wulumuqiensis]|uniref:DUF4097 family beta strand repeat-containing protein n=1 Tax=Paenibacillus wulumuqiensis TaxID=1567107 RepID=UPI0009E1B425|nr:DUF4097 family beta strand repeat-containing protein [Paenibacillus wulumuqiensis]
MSPIRLKRSWIIWSSLFLMVMVGIVIWLLYMNHIARPGTAHIQTWSAQHGELKHLRIDSDYEIAVQFEPSTDGKDSVQLHGELSTYVIRQLSQLDIHQNTLQLQLKQPHYPGDLWSGNTPAHVQYITVRLADPRSMESAEFQLASAQTNLTDVTADRIIAHSGSGRIKAQQLNGHAQLYTSSGDILVQQWHGEQLELESSSGSIRVNKASGRVHSFTGSGQLHIGRLDGEGQIEAKSGDVDILLADLHSLQVNAQTGNVLIHNHSSAEGNYDIHSETGQVKLPAASSHGQQYIRVRTTTGNITVN